MNIQSAHIKMFDIFQKYESFGDVFVETPPAKNLDECVFLQRLYPAIHRNDLLPVSFIKPNMETGPWIAGGAVNCWYQNTPVRSRDIDVWCSSSEQSRMVVENLIKCGATVVFSTKNAETLQLYGLNLNFPDDHYRVGNLSLNKDILWKIQVIRKKYFSSVEELVQNFDITVCQLATDGKQFAFSDDQVVHDLNHKILRFSKDSKISLRRMLKYMFYGYTPTDDQKKKFAEIDFMLEKNNNACHTEYDDLGDL